MRMREGFLQETSEMTFKKPNTVKYTTLQMTKIDKT